MHYKVQMTSYHTSLCLLRDIFETGHVPTAWAKYNFWEQLWVQRIPPREEHGSSLIWKNVSIIHSMSPFHESPHKRFIRNKAGLLFWPALCRMEWLTCRRVVRFHSTETLTVSEVFSDTFILRAQALEVLRGLKRLPGGLRSVGWKQVGFLEWVQEERADGCPPQSHFFTSEDAKVKHKNMPSMILWGFIMNLFMKPLRGKKITRNSWISLILPFMESPCVPSYPRWQNYPTSLNDQSFLKSMCTVMKNIYVLK